MTLLDVALVIVSLVGIVWLAVCVLSERGAE